MNSSQTTIQAGATSLKQASVTLSSPSISYQSLSSTTSQSTWPSKTSQTSKTFSRKAFYNVSEEQTKAIKAVKRWDGIYHRQCNYLFLNHKRIVYGTLIDDAALKLYSQSFHLNGVLTNERAFYVTKSFLLCYNFLLFAWNVQGWSIGRKLKGNCCKICKKQVELKIKSLRSEVKSFQLFSEIFYSFQLCFMKCII